MKKWKMVLTAAMPLAMALSFPAFAGEWQEDMNGWKYQNDDGSYCRSSRRWQVLRNIVFMRVTGIVGKCEKAENRVGN